MVNVAITREDLIKYFPHLYHMAEKGTWPSIKKRGLLSTTALLDLYEIIGKDREKVESLRRPDSVRIGHEEYGTAVIRDNKPISDKALDKCLTGMTKEAWYRLLNGKVFFWLSADRVSGLLAARAYREKEHVVITVDTAKLLAKYEAETTLSPINSGSTVYNPQPRDGKTFASLANYPFNEWGKKRGSPRKAIAELAVNYEVKDIDKMILRVERRQKTNILEVLYESESYD